MLRRRSRRWAVMARLRTRPRSAYPAQPACYLRTPKGRALRAALGLECTAAVVRVGRGQGDGGLSVGRRGGGACEPNGAGCCAGGAAGGRRPPTLLVAIGELGLSVALAEQASASAASASATFRWRKNMQVTSAPRDSRRHAGGEMRCHLATRRDPAPRVDGRNCRAPCTQRRPSGRTRAPNADGGQG